MVESIRDRGVHDARVLAAMQMVPRERFIPPEHQRLAYEDCAVPIEGGQTISQPYIVAAMIQALEVAPEDRVLEIGSGSGYACAVLSWLAREVHGVERLHGLVERSREHLAELGYDRVSIHEGDGSAGLPAHAPYDAILVSAGGPALPRGLLAQLAIGGRLVMPVGPSLKQQELIRVVREDVDRYTTTSLGVVTFVPLIGAEGWSELRPGTGLRRGPFDEPMSFEVLG